MFDTMINDWKSTRSFATQENLEKALAKSGLDKCHPLMVTVPGTGRFTAVFPKSMIENFMFAVHQGFKVLG